MVLTEIEFINGLTCLIIVVVFAIISMIIISKYVKSKEKIYLLFGLSWFFLIEAWTSASISFLIILITGGNRLPFELYVIIAISGYPFTLIIWIAALTNLVWKDKQKALLLITFFIGVIVEFFILYYIFTEPSMIGEFYDAVDINYGLFLTIYFLCLMLFFLLTGVLFSHLSMKLDNPEIRLRGRVLMLAFIVFVTGAFIDNLPTLYIPLIILGRIVMILSSIIFLLAFTLPNWFKRLFLGKYNLLTKK